MRHVRLRHAKAGHLLHRHNSGSSIQRKIIVLSGETRRIPSAAVLCAIKLWGASEEGLQWRKQPLQRKKPLCTDTEVMKILLLRVRKAAKNCSCRARKKGPGKSSQTPQDLMREERSGYLVVDDDVHRAVRGVLRQVRHVERLVHDTLPRERRIAVQQDTHRLKTEQSDAETAKLNKRACQGGGRAASRDQHISTQLIER